MIDYKKLLDSKLSTPFYVFDKQGFIENYDSLYHTMKNVYPNYQISYSYKTNYTPYICELVKKLGGYAEVVSDMEYELAKKIGYDNDKIVYNGPAKGKALFEHLDSNGIINIDSLDEAILISKYATKTKRNYSVGLRINLDVGGNFISRFGMSPDSEDLLSSINILHSANIKIIGLHCHISRNRGLDAWRKRAEIMISSANKYVDGLPKYISLGSGMYANMDEELKNQFDNVPSYEDYANAVMKPFFDRYGNNGPIVFTEPGTTLIARYISFVSSVLSIKQVRGRNMATFDGSYENLGEICTMKKLPIKKVKDNDGEEFTSIDLMGYTCLEQDLMYPNYNGKLSVGDVLAFENVGGYSIVSKPQFIKPNCRMLSYENDGNIKEIMKSETFEDVFSKFIFEEK